MPLKLVRCPHTCEHTWGPQSKSRRHPQALAHCPIFMANTKTLHTHIVDSGAHSQCSSTCPGQKYIKTKPEGQQEGEVQVGLYRRRKEDTQRPGDSEIQEWGYLLYQSLRDNRQREEFREMVQNRGLEIVYTSDEEDGDDITSLSKGRVTAASGVDPHSPLFAFTSRQATHLDRKINVLCVAPRAHMAPGFEEMESGSGFIQLPDNHMRRATFAKLKKAFKEQIYKEGGVYRMWVWVSFRVFNNFPTHLVITHRTQLHLLVTLEEHKEFEERVHVDYMQQTEWIHAVLQKRGVSDRSIQVLQNADLIVGGRDLSSDFFKLGELLKIKSMWPHPGELLFHGAKIPTLKHLTIVSKRLGHKFPDFKLAEPDDIRFCNNPNIVFKRSFSNDAEHVPFHNTEDRSKKVQIMKDELRLHYTDQMHLKPRWFMVPLIPHMQSAGEIHSFVVGGKLVYSVLTWVQEDGNVAFQAAPGVPRLADMRQHLDGHLNNHRGRHPHFHILTGTEGHRHYVESIVRGLVEEEENSMAGNISGLRIFCRVDATVFRDRNGDYHWTVSQLARSITSKMWPRGSEQPCLGTIASMAHLLVNYTETRLVGTT
ncbi:hypothetical protein BDN72DRAFT_448241 [Pluteus cervinus]|uniref:Uncharacterized protein n=1 Tax=Pluteus cervinus TaxID=181527 RepID=A0ACD3BCR9_9AGAR|nr:hypothetical protein BDN72DRAFT_448241 [Pluteus cervinus]